MTFQLGEVREKMVSDLLSKKLYEVGTEAHNEHNLNEFWIIISHKPDMVLCNIIREGIVVSNIKPPKMLGSMCFHFVWDKGIIEPEWVLPLDFGDAENLYFTEQSDQCDQNSLIYDGIASLGSDVLS